MKSRTGRGGFEDLMRQSSPVTFTEAELREVWDKHNPSSDINGEVRCSCGPETVPSASCRYCHALVDQKDYRATRHRSNCSRPSGFPAVGVTMLHFAEYTVDHLIEKLKDSKSRCP